MADETDAGSAEVQPIRLRLRAGSARDNPPGVTDYRWGGWFRTIRPPFVPHRVIQNSLMPKKTLPCRRQGILPSALLRTCLPVKRICPIHAEPVHFWFNLFGDI